MPSSASPPLKTVSVVICAYNDEPTVVQVMDKVLALGFVTELVVVDNGSHDRTGQIMQARGLADPRVKVLTINKNNGLGFGLVRGIRMTKGDITFLSDLLTNLNLTDVETASKAFRGDVIRELPLHARGFDIEIEMTFRLKQIGAIFYEVPISYYGRSVEEGKKIRFKDAISTVLAILKYGFLCAKKSKRVRLRHPERLSDGPADSFRRAVDSLRAN